MFRLGQPVYQEVDQPGSLIKESQIVSDNVAPLINWCFDWDVVRET